MLPPEDDNDASGLSRLPGFHRLSMPDRRQRLGELLALSVSELSALTSAGGLKDQQAEQMVENALGVFGLPLGVCANLQVDGRDRLALMAVEEPSVIAAASHAAKLLRAGGGVSSRVSSPHMVGQIQLLDVPEPDAAEAAVLAARESLLLEANSGHPRLVAAGGGAFDVKVRRLPAAHADDPLGLMLVVHLVVDVRDAMGANAINTMCERLAPRIEELTGGRSRLRILSNLCDQRTVKVWGEVPLSAFSGRHKMKPELLVQGIEEASVFAERDPYRAATHNKGIMNGVDAVLIAFGQDWRAVEAGAHAYAARHGRYTSLSRWRRSERGLIGEMILPMAVGVVGGSVASHPASMLACKIAGIESAADLASLTAAVGLAQNLGALRSLAAEGIQAGHMRLHARKKRANTRPESTARVISASAAKKSVANDFARLQSTYLPPLEALIRRVILENTPAGSTLSGMLEYQLNVGGKRLRALFPLVVAELLGIDARRLIPFGAACEILHTATLVHDDVQDGDRVRRNQPTLWVKFGEEHAIDMGDALLYYAVLLMQQLDFPVEIRERAVKRLLIETIKVVDGQEREFLLRDSLPTFEEYFRVVEHKTSSGFVLPIAGAAEVCGASQPLVESLIEAMQHLGVLYQIQYELLDVYGDKGRGERGHDIREGKRSLVALHACHNGSQEQRDWLLQVLDKPAEETTPEEVAMACSLFESLGSKTYAIEEIKRRKQQALNAPGVVEHQLLADFIAGTAELLLQPVALLL